MFFCVIFAFVKQTIFCKGGYFFSEWIVLLALFSCIFFTAINVPNNLFKQMWMCYMPSCLFILSSVIKRKKNIWSKWILFIFSLMFMCYFESVPMLMLSSFKINAIWFYFLLCNAVIFIFYVLMDHPKICWKCTVFQAIQINSLFFHQNRFGEI